ncbi:MAG: biotin/lipoyl-containing protein, partial [Pseudomonadota bacterium]
MAEIEIKVPDIGDFSDVPVISVLVSPGDTVVPEDPLIELESDKATMEVPAPQGGKVVSIAVKEGDSVSEGSVILTLEAEGAASDGKSGRVSGGGAPATTEQAGYGSAAGHHEVVDIRVPDIGDFSDVPVISVLVKPGDAVGKEDPLIELESDKATMEVPAPMAGTVVEVKVSEGDSVSEGALILTLETGAKAVEPAAPKAAPAPASRPTAPTKGDLHAEVLVLGSGPGGYTAAFRAADLGKKVVLVERDQTLGGVCLNVGCIPSKALLHAAKVITETEEMGAHGIKFTKPKIDLDVLRSWKDGVVGKLTGGLKGLAKGRKVTVVEGVGAFAAPNLLRVQTAEGEKMVSYDQAIIAAGSEPVHLPFIPHD